MRYFQKFQFLKMVFFVCVCIHIFVSIKSTNTTVRNIYQKTERKREKKK